MLAGCFRTGGWDEGPGDRRYGESRRGLKKIAKQRDCETKSNQGFITGSPIDTCVGVVCWMDTGRRSSPISCACPPVHRVQRNQKRTFFAHFLHQRVVPVGRHAYGPWHTQVAPLAAGGVRILLHGEGHDGNASLGPVQIDTPRVGRGRWKTLDACGEGGASWCGGGVRNGSRINTERISLRRFSGTVSGSWPPLGP